MNGTNRKRTANLSRTFIDAAVCTVAVAMALTGFFAPDVSMMMAA